MTPDQKALVKKTWNVVRPTADAAASLFYQRLFEIDPSTKNLFHTDISEQKRKLIQALTYVVDSLDRPERLMPVIEELGRRHANYGVVAPQYDSVGSALLWALEHGLQADWTPAVRTAWLSAYQFVSRIMRDAANSRNSPAL